MAWGHDHYPVTHGIESHNLSLWMWYTTSSTPKTRQASKVTGRGQRDQPLELKALDPLRIEGFRGSSLNPLPRLASRDPTHRSSRGSTPRAYLEALDPLRFKGLEGWSLSPLLGSPRRAQPPTARPSQGRWARRLGF
ncbi:hypothetical protein CRG98_032071 [Punica granatum]|uniref:Uncharacterized protein n=1 Tax=Punica granatum TaxID=22663 RepID=A0A2I0IU25_PUNGR|nr:hypothetical protein CRG98_032071 [Punica granatum]